MNKEYNQRQEAKTRAEHLTPADLRKFVAERIKQHNSNANLTVLEPAIGSGQMAFDINEKISSIEGYDISEQALKVAKDDIDKLKEPKALTNFQSYGNRTGKINHEKDNLLIKGNNLLALYSLLPKYRGKVKLIYIDPPYNTGNDGFKYNDNFKHSTWLTFMKNRLEVARELLSDDGVIFVQIDDNEQAYLQVLMDEVFGREGFVTQVIIKTASENGFKTLGNKPVRVKEYIQIYSKNIIQYQYYKAFVNSQKKWDTHFNLFVEIDDKTKYSLLEYIKMNKIVDNDFKLDGSSLKNSNFNEPS
jgi:adenine-specific DNA-methyltransferase